MTTPVITSAIGGQPGTLMIGLSVITLCTGVARVGFGFAACTQPHDAQEPHDTIAFASFATCRSFSTNGLAAGDAVDAVVGERRIAFDGEDVVALVLADRLLERFLRLVAGRRHERVVVVEREHRQHDVLRERVRGADERFGAARAFETVQPDDRRARLRLHRLRDLLRAGIAETERCGGQAAELEKAPARDSLPAHQFVIGF